MATPAYMFIDGIKGSVDKKDERKDSVEVLEFEHEVLTPTDAHTGKLTSTRKHESVRFMKAFDKSSALLYQAVCTGKTIKKIVIKWYEVDNTGKEKNYFTHELENVKISSVHPIMYNVKDPTKDKFVHMEEVQMRYEKITWTYPEGNITHTDAWDEPAA